MSAWKVLQDGFPPKQTALCLAGSLVLTSLVVATVCCAGFKGEIYAKYGEVGGKVSC